MFKVAIIGGEDTEDYNFFKERCIHFLSAKGKEERIVIYSYGDEFVKKFASEFRITVNAIYADWKAYGKDALKVRNIEICKECQGVIIFETPRNQKAVSHLRYTAEENAIPVRTVKHP